MTTTAHAYLPVTVREPAHTDLPMILSSWLQSFRDSKIGRGYGTDEYFELWGSYARHILSHPRVTLRVACNNADPDQIFGWVAMQDGAVIDACDRRIVISGPILHYVYVKHPFRGMAIARKLLAGTGITHDTPATFTHWTNSAEAYLGRYLTERRAIALLVGE